MAGSLLLRTAVLSALILAGVVLASAGDLKPGKVAPKDKCPVCGMFVARYPDFAGQIRFRDGATVHFDGAKDLAKYCLNPSRYAPGRKTADIAAVFVTEYYGLTSIDGLSAFYVLGSDVYGPMGRELIPFATESKARDFLKDHRGKSIIRFRDITPSVLSGLD